MPGASALTWIEAAGLGALAATLACAVLIPLARRAGWLDRPEGPDAARKLQDRPVPPVGGAAACLGFALLAALGVELFPGVERPFLSPPTQRVALAAVALAFVVGLVDDLLPRGLSPARKALGQLAIGVVASASSWPQASATGALASVAAWCCAALVATNLWNTFDNADGAAAGLGGCGLLVAASPSCGPLLGFLPWNLVRLLGRRAPLAYLGDSGSHVLGVAVLLTPAAWPACLLPALDLARLALVRWRVGSRPWRGDRRHLAHRLAARGLGRFAALACLLAIGLPAVVWPGAAGALASIALYVVTLLATRAPDTPVESEQG